MCPTTPVVQAAASQLTCRTATNNNLQQNDEANSEKFGGPNDVFSEKDNDISRTIKKLDEETKENSQLRREIEQFRPSIRWPDLIVQLFIHLGCLYGLFLCVWSAKLFTVLFGKLRNSSFLFLRCSTFRLWAIRGKSPFICHSPAA